LSQMIVFHDISGHFPGDLFAGDFNGGRS